MYWKVAPHSWKAVMLAFMLFIVSAILPPTNSTGAETDQKPEGQTEQLPAKDETGQLPAKQAAGPNESDSPKKGSETARHITVTDITADTSAKRLVKIVISADGIIPKPGHFTLNGPPRLVLDIPEVKSLYLQKAISVQHPTLKKIRIGERQNGIRLVFDARKSKIFPYSIEERGNTLLVWIGKKENRPAKEETLSVIESIDFESLEEGRTRLRITADNRPAYEVKRLKNRTVLLRLRQAVLPGTLAKPYDTSYFKGAVDSIIPKQSSKKTVEIKIRLRDDVPFKVSEAGNGLQMEFESTRVPPKPDRIAKLNTRALEDRSLEKETETEAANLPPEFSELAKDAPKDPLGSPHFEKIYTGQKISMDFQNADIHNVLRLLAEVSGLNIVAGEDVAGKVTLKLTKVPWDQALDVVIASNRLGMVKSGNVVRIAPLTKLKEESLHLVGLQQAEPLITEYIQVNYAKAATLKDQLEKMRSERGTVTSDDRTNKIIMKDTQTIIENAKAIVRALDEPTKQVLIEARIVEASTDFSRGLGVEWGSGSQSNILNQTTGGWDIGLQGRAGGNFAVNPGLPTNPYAALGFTFGHLTSPLINLDVRLLAMESEGKGQIVSSPKITTLDNKEAYIQQGAKVPYSKQTQDGISTEFTEATLKLTVVPHITPDNRISLSILAKKDEPDWTRQDKNGTPAINTKEAKTELLINNGDTVVIGGIIYEKEQQALHGVPGLHGIPVLGWLFKGQTKSRERTELLIFLSANTIKLE